MKISIQPCYYEDAENMSEKQKNFIKLLESKTGAKFNGRDMVDVDTLSSCLKSPIILKNIKLKN